MPFDSHTPCPFGSENLRLLFKKGRADAGDAKSNERSHGSRENFDDWLPNCFDAFLSLAVSFIWVQRIVG